LNLAESWRADVIIGHAKVHAVEQVEKFTTELQGCGFRQAKILGTPKSNWEVPAACTTFRPAFPKVPNCVTC